MVYPEDIRCTIFRHAVYKDGRLFPPHSSKEACEEAYRKGEIYGCSKPFIFTGKEVKTCDYI